MQLLPMMKGKKSTRVWVKIFSVGCLLCNNAHGSAPNEHSPGLKGRTMPGGMREQSQPDWRDEHYWEEAYIELERRAIARQQQDAHEYLQKFYEQQAANETAQDDETVQDKWYTNADFEEVEAHVRALCAAKRAEWGPDIDLTPEEKAHYTQELEKFVKVLESKRDEPITLADQLKLNEQRDYEQAKRECREKIKHLQRKQRWADAKRRQDEIERRPTREQLKKRREANERRNRLEVARELSQKKHHHSNPKSSKKQGGRPKIKYVHEQWEDNQSRDLAQAKSELKKLIKQVKHSHQGMGKI